MRLLALALVFCAHVVSAAVVTVDFDMGVTFGDLVMDTSTYVAHVDVTVNLPFDNARLIPYLQVGPTFNLPAATYTQANTGNTHLDAIPCLASSSPMTTPNDFSCATLSREQLLPFNCSAARPPLPAAFTLDDVRSSLAASTPHPFSSHAATTAELSMLANEAPATHHHYDIATPVKGALYPLYCGEALMSGDAAAAAVACAQYGLSVSDAESTRIHAAKIVPYVSFPSATKMTYHFAYSIPQLQTDCGHNGVTTTLLYGDNGDRVIGSQTTFTLAFGYVYPSFTVHTDQRQYQVNIYTGSSQSNDAVFSVAFEMPSQYQVSLTLCDNPMPIYVNRTWAQLPYCYAVTYLNVGSFGTAIGPRILTAQDGKEYGDIDTVVLPNNVFGTHLQSITPGYDSRSGKNDVFCPPNSMKCVYVFRFLTAPQKLSTDGHAFVGERNVDNRGPFDMSFPAFKCERDPSSGHSTDCALLIPDAASGNTTFYDTFLVTLTKNVYPDMNASYVFASRLDLFTQNDISFANMLDVVCRSSSDTVDAGVEAMCRDGQREAVRTGRGNTLAMYMSVINPTYWNNSLGVEEMDPSSIVFTIRGRRPQSYGGIDPLVIHIDSTDATKWQAFQQTWSYAPRRTVLAGPPGGVAPLAPLVSDSHGIDAIHVDYSKLFFLLVDHYGVQYTDILDTLSVSAFVDYRYAGVTQHRRLLSSNNVPLADGDGIPVGLRVSSTQSQTIPMTRFEMTCLTADQAVIVTTEECSRTGVSWSELVVILVAYAVVLTCICFVVYRHTGRSVELQKARHVRRSSDEIDDDDAVGPLIANNRQSPHDATMMTFAENPFANPDGTRVRSRTNTPQASKRTLKGAY